jgi:hypothetical protein
MSTGKKQKRNLIKRHFVFFICQISHTWKRWYASCGLDNTDVLQNLDITFKYQNVKIMCRGILWSASCDIVHQRIKWQEHFVYLDPVIWEPNIITEFRMEGKRHNRLSWFDAELRNKICNVGVWSSFVIAEAEKRKTWMNIIYLRDR